jgi:PAS domain S-box-containing protein
MREKEPSQSEAIAASSVLAAIVESSDDAIVSKDLSGTVISWNKAAETIFGYKASEVIGGPISIIIPPDRGAEELDILQRISRGERIEHFETERLRKDGQRVQVAVTISPLIQDGRIIGASKIARDITARKKAEQELADVRAQLKKHSEELEVIVAERTAELRHALTQLETFSYSISHDLRAPLRAISGFVDMVLSDHGDVLPQPGRDLLGRAAKSARRLSSLIEEVLNSAQTIIKREQLRPIALTDLVTRVIEEYPNLREHRGRIEIKHPLAIVLGTEPLLTQVISNLLGNAMKFMPSGRAPEIVMWTETHGDNVRLHIRDNGIGIVAQDQAHVFEMFSRGANVQNIDGSGIGLAVVARALTRMGGRVGVVSTPDVGSDFWIELPAATEAPSPALHSK